MAARAAARRSVSPRKKPSQARSLATVDTILAAAARVFQTHGYAAGTTNRIAERAGVSIGSLYEYFPSKDAILVALGRRHLEDGVAIVRALLAETRPDTAAPELLERIVTAMIALHEQNPRLHRVLFEETPLPGVLRREIAEGESALVRAVAVLLASRTDVDVRDPDLAAYLTVHLVEAMTHRFVLYPPPGCGREAFVREVVHLLERYLVGANGREGPLRGRRAWL